MINLIRLIMNAYFTIFYRLKITGIENIPKKGGAIICPNHVGQLDMFFIGIKTKRLIRYMAKEELFRNPILGKLISYLGAFPVKRSFADVSSLKNVFKLLNEGHIVGIFPEGTRMRNKDRSSVKVKNGAAMFATEANVPVIPVGISGDYRLFGRIHINIGQPYMLSDDKDKKFTKQELHEMSELIMDKVYELMGDE